VSTLTLTNLAPRWQYEYARAADAAGEYLFICAPLLCAIVALNARLVLVASGAFAVGSANPRAGAYRTWTKFAALAALVHAIVLGAALFVVWRSDGIRTLSPQPFVRQFAMIVLACALGAFLGAWIRSLVFPAVVFVLTIFVALLVPATHLRPFLLAGWGTFDFTYQRYAASLLLVTCVAAAGAMAASCWATRWRRVALIATRALAGVAVVTVITGLSREETFRLDWRDRPAYCLQQEPEVCAPAAMDPIAFEVGDVARGVSSAVPAVVAHEFPSRLDLVAPGRHEAAPGDVEVETADARDYDAVAYQTIRALSGANLCADALPAQKVEAQMVGGAVVIGWLEHAVGIDLPGSYPSDLTAKLMSLPRMRQSAVVAQVMRQVRSCEGVDLSGLQ
jgi:hypothetical protein